TFALDLPGTDLRTLRYEVDDDAGRTSDVVTLHASTTWSAPGYVDAFDTPLRAGRTVSSGDDGAAGAAIVNASFVRDVLRGQSAIGRRIGGVNAAGVAGGPWIESVGVAPDVALAPANPTRAASVYRPLPPGRT